MIELDRTRLPCLVVTFFVAMGFVNSTYSDEPNISAEQRLAIELVGESVIDSTDRRSIELKVQSNDNSPRESLKDSVLNWSLERDSQFKKLSDVDPELGFDHAVGAKSELVIDGVQYSADAIFDANDFTSFETAWTNGFGDALLTIDLQQRRNVTALKWLAADANWIWNADVSTSLDGKDFNPIDELQNVDMHQKWGSNDFRLTNTITARYLRFRFHKSGDRPNIIRLPMSINVYDGSENDVIPIDEVGPVLDRGSIAIKDVPAEGLQVAVALTQPLQPGAYRLNATISTKRNKKTNAAESLASLGQRALQLLVLPSDSVDKSQTRRFGINSSQIKYAESMSRCGFGWVRFENAKWAMFCPAPGVFAFDGTVAPWFVNQDQIYDCYHDLDMNVLPYIFQTPEWATKAGREVTANRAGYPPREAKDYGEAVFQLTSRYGPDRVSQANLKTADKVTGKNRVHAIELWNEPNLVGPSWAAFVGPIEEYFQVMRSGVEGIRRASPGMLITSCGWAGVDLTTVDKMRSYRYSDGKCPLDLVDVINVHFYSGKENPETCLDDPNLRVDQGKSGQRSTYPEQLDQLIAWRDQNKKTAEIWLTETGNDVGGPIGLGERDQAAKVPRAVLLTLAKGIDKVFIYRESGSDPSMHAGAGLLRNDGSVRPVWLTVATMIRQLAGYEGAARRIDTPDKRDWIYEWTKPGHRLLTAWRVDDPTKATETKVPAQQVTGSLSLDRVLNEKSLDRNRIAVVDAFGRTIDSKEWLLTGLVEVGDFPIYIHIQEVVSP